MAAIQELDGGARDPAEELIGLLRATARGDRVAFERLYQCTSPTLFGVARSLLRRQEWAEEAVQDAYLRIWYHADEYHPSRGRALTWMISIVRYRAIDLLRRQRTPQAANGESGDRDTPDPEALAVALHDTHRLLGCLGDLTERQRRSIVLAFFEGLTHAELAHRLEVPLGTIKSWVRRGLAILKECLER
jgi:RNA polymerase sigma-70 factor (ECF subfamily)